MLLEFLTLKEPHSLCKLIFADAYIYTNASYWRYHKQTL